MRRNLWIRKRNKKGDFEVFALAANYEDFYYIMTQDIYTDVWEAEHYGTIIHLSFLRDQGDDLEEWTNKLKKIK